jgi:hypothetical protein
MGQYLSLAGREVDADGPGFDVGWRRLRCPSQRQITGKHPLAGANEKKGSHKRVGGQVVGKDAAQWCDFIEPDFSAVGFACQCHDLDAA